MAAALTRSERLDRVLGRRGRHVKRGLNSDTGSSALQRTLEYVHPFREGGTFPYFLGRLLIRIPCDFYYETGGDAFEHMLIVYEQLDLNALSPDERIALGRRSCGTPRMSSPH
jgi:hypothetical protein